jgi:ATP-dependent Lon protease
VICPHENEPDLEELPPEARADIEFVLVDKVEQVFDAAFESKVTKPRRRPRAVPPERQAAASA